MLFVSYSYQDKIRIKNKRVLYIEKLNLLRKQIDDITLFLTVKRVGM